MDSRVYLDISRVNGDILMECDTCSEHKLVPYPELNGAFADVIVGRYVLEMLQHIHTEHGAGVAVMRPKP